MRKIIMVALSICAILEADASAAEKAKVPQGKENSTIQGKYFELLKSNILSCRSWQLTEKEVLNTEYQAALLGKQADNLDKGKGARLTAVERVEIEQKVVSEKQAKGFEYKKCIDDAKAKIAQGGAKEFLGAFASTQKPKAKALLAQWLTVMDAIGQDNFDQEVSKYDSLVNGLKVEAMTN